MGVWDDVRARLREYVKRVPEEDSEIGTLGAVIAGAGVVNVPGRAGFVYVRLKKGTVVQAYNPSTGAVFGLEVRLRSQYGVLTVVGANVQAITSPGVSAGIVASATVGQHSHRLGSGNEDLVEGLRMEPGLVRGNGGLVVRVEAFAYWYQGARKLWLGGNLDLTPYRPATANTQAWVLVGLDMATETLVAVTGTEQALALTLLPTTIFDEDFPHLLLGAVRLRNGQVSAPTQADFYDPRSWQDDGAWRAWQDNGTPITPRRTINVFGAGVTVTDDAANDKIDLEITGGGGGGGAGVLHEYLGYNTIGASTEVMVGGRVYMKQITTSADGILASIAVYCDHNTATNVQGLGVHVMTDDSGTPGIVFALGARYATQEYYPNTTARWVTLPVNVFLPAGTYWICVQRPIDPGSDLRIYYDTGGSDRIQSIGDNWVADASLTATSNSTRTYSLRASFVQTGLAVSTANVSNPPTDAELDTAFGTPAAVGAGFHAFLNDNGAGTNFYHVASDGTNWWYSTFTKAT